MVFGIKALNPTEIAWLMDAHHDWGTHYLGWAFYRLDAWSFPLGTIHSYNYPVGTNVGFTDSIPLLAIPFKLFSFLLPDDLQYFGLWLLSCFYLNGHFTFKILDNYQIPRKHSLLIVILIICSPILIYRSLHPALCAHWLILASIYYYIVKSTPSNVFNLNSNQISILVLSGFINPYLTAMVIGFNVILPLKHVFIDQSISFKKAVLFPISGFFLLLLSWIFIGLIDFNQSANLASVDDYNNYSFNLNSLYNGRGFSTFLPDLPIFNPMQYEGFAYLGLGIMILLALGFIGLWSIRNTFKVNFKYFSFILLLCSGMVVFALTNKISLGDKIILDYKISGNYAVLAQIFRATGRFVWPMYYFGIISLSIFFLKLKFNSTLKMILLSLVVCIQFYDIKTLITYRNLKYGLYDTPLEDSTWRNVFKNFNGAIVYPPFNYNYSQTYPMDYQDLCYLSLKEKKPISNAYIARTDVIKTEAYKMNLERNLSSGLIDPNQLFITTLPNINAFGQLLHDRKVSIRKLDGFYIVYPTTHDNLLKNVLPSTGSALKFQDSLYTYYEKAIKNELIQNNDKLIDKGQVKFNLDNYNVTNSMIQVRGWAMENDAKDTRNDSIFMVLSNEKTNYLFYVKKEDRGDLVTAFNNENLKGSGFNGAANFKKIPKGNYQLGLIIKKPSQTKYYVKTDKSIQN
jgi:hypothetical protein